jgi:type II secretory pathway pseudopilin PulG
MEKKAERATMPILIAGNPKNNQRGFTYVMILVAVVITGIFAEVATFYASRSRQIDREKELLFRGTQYRNAIKSYYEAGKPIKTYPRSLNDLLKDSRAAHKSHIRALYPDPFGTEKGEWKLLRAKDGGISGVASQSTAKPLKTGGFRVGYEKFEGASSYSDWVFEYALNATSGVPRLQQSF